MPSKQRVLYFLQLPHRLGQLVAEVWFLRNMFDDDDYEFVVITPPLDERVNKACYDFVTRDLTVVQKSPNEVQWSTTNGIRQVDGDIYVYQGAFDFSLDFFKRFHHEKPGFYFSFSEQDRKRSLRLREMFNIPHDARIVTLHNRESGYLPGAKYHDYRNASIRNYLPAVQYLMDRDFYVVRIGDKTMEPLPAMGDRVIDMPFHPLYSHFVELHFIEQSKFLLSVPSGPCSVSMTLNVPTLIVNMPVHARCYLNDHDLCLPKRYYSRHLERYLTYGEIICSPVVDYYRTEEYERFGVELHENSADEILQTVKEMDARIDATYSAGEQVDQINTRIKRIQRRGDCFRRHYCEQFPFFSPYHLRAQISNEFIGMNPWFVEDRNWEPAEQMTSERDAGKRECAGPTIECAAI